MKRYAGVELESINMANVLMLLSRGRDDGGGRIDRPNEADGRRRVFECKTCNRQFPSFQALGGHRASHKKPRLSDDNYPCQDRTQSAVTKPKVHECSICGLEFAIGQALGGHMRRHRSANHGQGFGHGIVEKISNNNGKRVVLFDLNLPPSDDEMEMIECRKLGLGLAPMADCLSFDRLDYESI